MSSSITLDSGVLIEGGGHVGQRLVADRIGAESNEAKALRKKHEEALWYWNLACAIFHGFQAAVALGLGLGSSGNYSKFTLPFTTNFLVWPGEGGAPQVQLLYRSNIKFAALASGFAWMSCVAHVIVLIFFRTVYLPDLRKGINKFRWYEYAASSSLMIFLIAMLFGMYDIVSLVLLMAVNASMNLFGYLMELINQYTPAGKVDWTAFYFGCFAGIIPWCAIIAYLAGSQGQGSGSIPAFVWAIFFVYLFCFNTFPVNMLLTYYGKWWLFNDEAWGYRGAGYLFGEKLYQIQSLVSKSILLWLVLGGVNQPNSTTK